MYNISYYLALVLGTNMSCSMHGSDSFAFLFIIILEREEGS